MVKTKGRGVGFLKVEDVVVTPQDQQTNGLIFPCTGFTGHEEIAKREPFGQLLGNRCLENKCPHRDSIFTKGPVDVLDDATSEIAIGTKWEWAPRGSLPVNDSKGRGRR